MEALEELSESYQGKDEELRLESRQKQNIALRVGQLEVPCIDHFICAVALCILH